MDTTQSVVQGWRAIVRCKNCRLTFDVPYADRHAGSRKMVNTSEALVSARCKHCPVGLDFTEWTGIRSEKPV